jgi:hypothetical protein
MKTRLISRPAFAALLLSLPGLAPAQTYLGNGSNLLNGTSLASTFEIGDGTASSLPFLGWTPLSGNNVQIWDVAGDGVILDIGGGFNAYSVQFVTDSALAANSTYTLSLEMGYVSGPGTGNANYSMSIGTWNGATFTPLQTVTDGPVTNFQAFASGTAGVTQTATFTTGGSVSGDMVAIQWAQTNTSSGADYFAVDNVTLSVAAVPEPSTYAAILGAGALGVVVWRRRLRPCR